MQQLMKKHHDRIEAGDGGFTLIELLVVITILGILAAIVVFSVGGITDTGKSSACKATAKTVDVASEAYRAQIGTYSPDLGTLGAAATRFLKLDASQTSGNTITLPKAGGSVTYVPASGDTTNTCA
jgi:general secretion pathway protein G